MEQRLAIFVVVSFISFYVAFAQNHLSTNSTVPFLEKSIGNETNITTTTFPVTTTSAPEPTPTPSAGHWHFNYSDGRGDHYCILFDAGSVELEITYPTQNGSHKTLAFKVPDNARVVPGFSHCGSNLSNAEINETLALNMTVLGGLKPLLRFHFTRDPNVTGDKSLDKSQLYNITAEYTYNGTIFKDIDPKLKGTIGSSHSNVTLHEFSVLKDRSYQCVAASQVRVDEKLTVKFGGVRVQAFLASDHFSSPEPCSSDVHSSDLVPIIIGAVLAAIVLIVLIAYLIGRARMRRTTYESI